LASRINTPDPSAAAAELERAVTQLGLDGAMIYGRTRDRTMDAPEFWPIYEAAQALRAPLHLHPRSPPPAVRGAYYSGYGARLDASLRHTASAGTTRAASSCSG
jgi:predicted TIM-barrel fold metal-dependent hydrolase